jgi:hypothetical protein
LIRIKFSDIEYPEHWLEQSRAASEAIEQCADRESRGEYLSGSGSEVWRDARLKECLAKLSHYKCWYCETPIIRDDLVVDHYRPKGKIFEEPEEDEGYWWLAFDAINFRLACKYCNELRNDVIGKTRGGKGTHFPLLEGSVRATAEDRDLSNEFPVILDPLRAVDVGYLIFLSDSQAWPKFDPEVNLVAFKRAKDTIVILHLNQARLRKGRGQVCNQVAEAIDRCDIAYRRYLRRSAAHDEAATAEAREAYADAIQRLDDFLKDSSSYAAAARSVLRQARGQDGREWLEELL